MSAERETPGKSAPAPGAAPDPAPDAGPGPGVAPAAALAPFAWLPVGIVLAVTAAVLLSMLTGYGYHRDELYFRVLADHPAWGYVDQPPLTPMLARLGMAVLGDTLWALRIPALLCALASIVLTTALARELGGGRIAQTLTAAGAASSPFLLLSGHILSTATPDLTLWLLAILCLFRALLRDDPRWWPAAGLAVGLALFNKQLIVLLLIGLLVGLLAAGPRRVLASRWLWAGVAIAVLVALPTLIYQIVSGWPELSMSRAIARNKGHDDRILFVPFQLLLMGPPLVPVWVSGMLGLLREPAWRALRAFGWAYPVISVIVLVTGGQPYYTLGALLPFWAAGCVRLVARRTEARRIEALRTEHAPEGVGADRHRQRWTGIGTAIAVNAAVSVVIVLPLLPVRTFGPTLAALNQVGRDSVGWPAYVREVADVYRSLPPADRAHAVLLTGNYGEAGALARFGAAYHLPAVYSGHNQLHEYGPPPASATVAVVVGFDRPAPGFVQCTWAAGLDNGVGVPNEEQHNSIQVCRQLRTAWPQLWPSYQHFD